MTIVLHPKGRSRSNRMPGSSGSATPRSRSSSPARRSLTAQRVVDPPGRPGRPLVRGPCGDRCGPGPPPARDPGHDPGIPWPADPGHRISAGPRRDAVAATAMPNPGSRSSSRSANGVELPARRDRQRPGPDLAERRGHRRRRRLGRRRSHVADRTLVRRPDPVDPQGPRWRVVGAQRRHRGDDRRRTSPGSATTTSSDPRKLQLPDRRARGLRRPARSPTATTSSSIPSYGGSR